MDTPTERLSRVRTCHHLQRRSVGEGGSGDKEHPQPRRLGWEVRGTRQREVWPLVTFNACLLLPAKLSKKKKRRAHTVLYCQFPAFSLKNYQPFVFDLHRNLLSVFI